MCGLRRRRGNGRRTRRGFWARCVSAGGAQFDDSGPAVCTAEGEIDADIGECRDAGAQLFGEDPGGAAGDGGAEQVQESGGAAGPAAEWTDESADGFDEGVRR